MTSPRTLVPETDFALMGRTQTGDVKAFSDLYDRHARSAFRVAFSICRNTGQAEEAVQEGFLTIWKKRASFQSDRGSFSAWSMGIFRRRAIDSVRSRARQSQDVEITEPLPDESGSSTANVAITGIRNEELRATLELIPPAQAEVISLAFFGQLSQTEISEILDLPHGAIKGRMRLGLEKLRSEIKNDPRRSSS